MLRRAAGFAYRTWGAVVLQMQAVGLAAQLTLAAVFLWASLAKLSATGRLSDTIGRLGVPAGLATAAAPSLVALEVAAAVGLIIGPAWWWPRVLAVLLATSFAVAGTVAVATRRTIACHCFGSVGDGVLGWRQVGLLPLWLGLAALAQRWHVAWGVDDGLGVLVVVLLALTAVRLPGHVRTVRTLRADRVAMVPTYRGFSTESEEIAP